MTPSTALFFTSLRLNWSHDTRRTNGCCEDDSKRTEPNARKLKRPRRTIALWVRRGKGSHRHHILYRKNDRAVKSFQAAPSRPSGKGAVDCRHIWSWNLAAASSGAPLSRQQRKDADHGMNSGINSVQLATISEFERRYIQGHYLTWQPLRDSSVGSRIVLRSVIGPAKYGTLSDKNNTCQIKYGPCI